MNATLQSVRLITPVHRLHKGTLKYHIFTLLLLVLWYHMRVESLDQIKFITLFFKVIQIKRSKLYRKVFTKNGFRTVVTKARDGTNQKGINNV